MRPKSAWVSACPSCGYLESSLEPGAGAAIKGLENLRRSNYEKLLDRLERRRPLRALRVLDVGSGWGWFMAAAQRRGAVVHGIEAEEVNAEVMIRQGLSVECGFFPVDLKDRNPYDVIVFNDVFEHLAQPSRVVQEVQALLRPGGMAVFNYPSSRGILFRIATVMDRVGLATPLARLWQKGFPSPHISYFNPGNLPLLMQRHSTLEQIDSFDLQSLSLDGLAERVGGSHSGPVGLAMVAALWLLSFVLPLLPSDIRVSVFRNPQTSAIEPEPSMD